MAAWLHQLTAITADQDILYRHGVRGGKAMNATLRWWLIAVPDRLIRHARHLVLRLPPGHYLLPEVLAPVRELPASAYLSSGSRPFPAVHQPLTRRKAPQTANPAPVPGY